MRIARRKDRDAPLTGPDGVELEHLRFDQGDALQREIESFAQTVRRGFCAETRDEAIVPASRCADGVRSLEADAPTASPPA